MPEDFRVPYSKLYRADSHIIDFNSLLKAFMDTYAYKAFTDLNVKALCVSWVAQGEDTFPKADFASIVGDIIQNLRNALDIAVSTLMRNAGKSDSNVFFPTADSPDAFEGAVKKGLKYPDCPMNLFDIFKRRIEPYIGGNDQILRALHNLSIMDKHRLGETIVFGADHIVATIGGRKYVVYAGLPRPIKDGDVLAFVSRGDFEGEVANEAEISLAVEFNQVPGMQRWPISYAIGQLFNATEKAIKTLETCL